MISGIAKIDDSTGAVAAASVRELPATTPTTMPSVQAMTIAATISPTVVAKAARNTPPSVAAAATIALGAARMIWLTRPERTTASHAASETAVMSKTLPARDRVMPFAALFAPMSSPRRRGPMAQQHDLLDGSPLTRGRQRRGGNKMSQRHA